MITLYESIFSPREEIASAAKTHMVDKNIPLENQYTYHPSGGSMEIIYSWIFADTTKDILLPQLKKFDQLEVAAIRYERGDPWRAYIRVAKNPYIVVSRNGKSNDIAFDIDLKRKFNNMSAARKYIYSILKKIGDNIWVINELYDMVLSGKTEISAVELNKMCK